MSRYYRPFALLLLPLLVACGGDETATTTTAPPASETTTVAQSSPSAPVGEDPTEEEMERERFDDAWKDLDSINEARERERQPAETPSDTASSSTFAQRGERTESLDGISIETARNAPVLLPIRGDVSGPSVLKTQVYLDHADFSPGVIDGRWGKNTAIAVYWFQHANGLNPTGEIDRDTFTILEQAASIGASLTRYSVSKADLEGQFVEIPDDPYEKADLDCLCYESVIEKLAETFHTTPDFLSKLNEGTDFSALREGQQIVVPNAPTHRSSGNVSRIVISVEGNYLHGMDGNRNIVFHYPTTVGSKYDPSPSQELEVTAIAWDPTFHYQPKLFHEVSDEKPDVVMQPGPNSPVGIVWMQLSKENYGIHGTAAPSTIGYTSSHGCIRLTNWDARELGHAVDEGATVVFTDPRRAAPGAKLKIEN
ncbi:MAG: L,D-transpeptidase [Thermoanaerobaculia bacterium]|nr:L,D-transpeptidase [Thermoanaerobaculia bacterium]